MDFDSLESRYQWQFQRGRGIDHCTPEAWLPVLADLFDQVNEIVPAELRPMFAWTDVKEKRGRLAVDFMAPANCAEALDAAIEAAIVRVSCSTK
jgi:hypothetical protein